MMSRKAKVFSIAAGERGMALIWVLILFLLGSLLVVPLLGLAATGLKTGQVFERKTGEQFAADAGIEEGIWRIKYDYWGGELQQREYDKYDFSTNWSYRTGPVNGITAEVTIRNVWIPSDVPPPAEPALARQIIESDKLMVLGTSPNTSSYEINISFSPDTGAGDNLTIKSLGIWLPYGFSYIDGSSNLEDWEPLEEYYPETEIHPYAGGQAVVWTFDQPPPLTSFPGFETQAGIQTAGITFSYTADEPGSRPAAIAWVSTEDSDIAGILPVTWDIDTRIYKITSRAGDTVIEAYSAKIELRKMIGAIAGQYVAVGNSLMTNTDGDWWGIRDKLLSESSSSVSDIPPDAEVVAAYLYWSGWINIFDDDCSNFTNWISGSAWNISSGHFRSHYSMGGETSRYLRLKDSLNLSAYTPGTVQVSWEQWVEGTPGENDRLYFAFSDNGGSTWSSNIEAFRGNIGGTPQSYSYTIPSAYLTSNFKFRFYLDGFGDSGEYANVGNFAISEITFTPDTSVIFKINGQPVYLDEHGDPRQGDQPLAAGSAQSFRNPWQDFYAGYSYACRRDVTRLVQAYSGEGTGNAEYTVGGVQATTGHHLSYAGWSLIIVYASPETAGHYLYLYDRFVFHPGNGANPDFDGNGEPGMDISGFIVPEPIPGETVAAKLTAFVGEGDNWFSGDYLKFNAPKPNSNLSNPESPAGNVWNGRSYPRSSNDGVDIDTFTITWDSGLLEPKQTTAHLDLPSDEAYNLIYLILSVRSETTMGGFLSYLMK